MAQNYRELTPALQRRIVHHRLDVELEVDHQATEFEMDREVPRDPVVLLQPMPLNQNGWIHKDPTQPEVESTVDSDTSTITEIGD